MPSLPSKSLLAVLSGAVIISFSAVFARLADTPPAAVGFYRLFFGGLALTAITLITGELRPGKFRFAATAPFALAGLVFALDMYFWHMSIEAVGPGLATILGNFQVFFMAFFGVVFFRERMSFLFFASVSLAFVGLFMLVGEDFSRLSGDYRLGVFFGLITAVCYAVYMLLLKWAGAFENALTPRLAMTVASLAGAAALGVAVFLEGESFVLSGPRNWLILLAYGVLAQAVGWVLISKGITKIRASVAGLAILMQPALSFLWDILFFGRSVSLLEGCGLGLALGAIYLAVRRNATTAPPEDR